MIDNDHPGEKQRNDEEPSIPVAEYWAIIRRRRKLIALIVLLVTTAAVVSALMGTPLYRATVLLHLEKEKSSSALDLGANPGYVAPDPEFLPTQRDLMRSREVARRVVEKLRLLDAPGASDASLSADNAAARAAEDAAISVQNSIETRPRRGTNLVELSVVSANPKLAADMANAVAESYIEWNIESKYLVVGQASTFLATQIEQLKGELALKEKELQAYGRQKDIVSIDPGANTTMQKLESFNRDYAEAVADRVAKEARYYELQTASPETIADNLSSGLVSQLRNDQARMERDYAEKLNVYKPNWPAMQQARAQIEKGKQNLDAVIQETVEKARDNARTEYRTAQRREQSLKAVIEGQTNEAMTLNSNAVEYNNLQTEVQTKRTLLDTLLRRQAETEVSSRLKGERVSNIQIVERALIPRSRFTPSTKKNLVLGGMLGLFLGIGMAFVLEYLDRSLRSLEQVERILHVPALGLIPSISANSGLVYGYGPAAGPRRKERKLDAAANAGLNIELLPHTQPRSTIAEAYRAFRTALLLSRAGGLKTIVMTSVLPGEGKTTTASNLAVVLAQLEKRVLLVDADLHKPRVHELFKISNRAGLVSVLAENADSASVTVPTPVAGLFVMPAGPSSPNPSGLLSSDAMATFLERSATEYDYIIIDTPPVGPVADAILLGYQTDGVVLCVQGGKTSRERVRQVRDRLARSNVRLLGVVLNNLDQAAAEYAEYYGAYGGVAYGEKLSKQAATG